MAPRFGPKTLKLSNTKGPTKDQNLEASSTLAWSSLCSERKPFTAMGTYTAALAFISCVGYNMSKNNYHCINYLK